MRIPPQCKRRGAGVLALTLVHAAPTGSVAGTAANGERAPARPPVAGAAGALEWGDPADPPAMYSFDGIPFPELGGRWETGFEEDADAALLHTVGPVTAEIVPEIPGSTNRVVRLQAHGKNHAIVFAPERFALRAEHFWRLRLRLRVRGPAGVGNHLRLRNEPLAGGQPTELGRREAFHPLTREWAWVGLADVAPAKSDRMRFELRIPAACTVEIDALSLDTETPRGWNRRVQPGAVAQVAPQDRRALAGAQTGRTTAWTPRAPRRSAPTVTGSRSSPRCTSVITTWA